MGGRWLLWIALAGCGRISFDVRVDGATDDASDITDALTAGPSGNIYPLDGMQCFVTFDAVCGAIASSFTFSSWFLPRSPWNTGGSVPFVINGAGGSGNLTMVLWGGGAVAGQAIAYYYDDFFTMRTIPGTPVTPDAWHHLAVTMDAAGNGVVYVDGAVHSTVATPRTVTEPCRVSVGQDWDGTTATEFFFGAVDEVQFWSEPFTAQEIQTLVTTEQAPATATLIGRYDFDAGDARDSSGNNLHGTMVQCGVAPL